MEIAIEFGSLPLPVGGNRSQAVAVAAVAGPVMRLNLRSRVEALKGSGQWREVSFTGEVAPPQRAVIICDMRDKHWCRGAAERVEVLAHKAEPVLERLRAAGLLIIHAS